MGEVNIVDPFVSSEPEVEIDTETSRILEQRTKTADQGRLVSPEEARLHIRQWLSNSSTT
ncbi:MAG TPA: hypothetical protein VGZ73_04150 [Bryobacteraceae bacterium]|jgi:hypothetical protein|nr:hypothetical protein [Bryobacteraceae bacterium]